MEGICGDFIDMESPRNVLTGPSWSDLSCFLYDDTDEIEAPSTSMALKKLPIVFDPPTLASTQLMPEVSNWFMSADIPHSGGSAEVPRSFSAPYATDSHAEDLLGSIKCNEASIQQDNDRLGGGEQGMRVLVDSTMFCDEQRNRSAVDLPSIAQRIEHLCMSKAPNGSSLYADNHNSSSCCSPLPWKTVGQDLENSSGQVCGVHPAWEWQQRGQEGWQRHSQLPARFELYATETASLGVALQSAHVKGFNTLHQQLAQPSMSCDHQQHNCGQSGEVRSTYDATYKEAAAHTRAVRKIRMTRQRKQQSRQLHHSCNTSSYASPKLTSSSIGHFSETLLSLTSEIDSDGRLESLLFLLHKELRPSDVSSLGRMVLPKKEAERHLPFLAMREGITMTLEDYHTGKAWSLRFRFWPNNKSRMYLLENTGDFVKYHHLQEGDLLVLYRNLRGTYVIRGKKTFKQDVAHRGIGIEDKKGERGVSKRRRIATKA